MRKFSFLLLILLSSLLIKEYKFEEEVEVEEELDEEVDENEDENEEEKGETPAESSSDSDEPPNCNQSLLNSLGLLGVSHSEEMKMDICTSVTDSCCQLEDQLAIFDNFQSSKDIENLNARFEYHKKVYNQLIEEIKRSIPVAQKIYEEQKESSPSNCGIIAERFLSFKVEEVIPLVHQSMTELHSFFLETYKGIYCSVCDAKNQTFFDSESPSIVLGEKFCREITGKSLHFLLYFHIHFKRILAIVEALVTYCDHKGDYLENESIPGAVHLLIKEEYKSSLNNCKNYRNDPTWFEHCANICEEFHISRYAEYFQPDLKKYHMATLYIRSKLDIMENPENTAAEERMLYELTRKKKKKSRLLNDQQQFDEEMKELDEANEESAEESKEETIPDLEKKFDDLTIIPKNEDAEVRLDKLKISFEQPGVELFEAGSKTILTEEAYQMVLEEIKKRDKLAKQIDDEDEFVKINSISYLLLFISFFLLKK